MRLATSSSIGVPRRTILSFNSLEDISYPRSPVPVWSTTIGTSTFFSFIFQLLSYSSAPVNSKRLSTLMGGVTASPLFCLFFWGGLHSGVSSYSATEPSIQCGRLCYFGYTIFLQPPRGARQDRLSGKVTYRHTGRVCRGLCSSAYRRANLRASRSVRSCV